MKFLLLAFSLSIASFAFGLGSDPKYPVSAISEPLKLNANAVFRENISTFTITGRDKATHYVHQVITILNAKAKGYASKAVFYDKLRKVRSLSATLYDAEGKQLKRLKDKDITDHSATGDAMFSDDRFKFFDLTQGTYPYTVEIEYEIDYRYLFHIPPFYVVDDEDVSCQKATYSLKYKAPLKPRTKIHNYTVEAAELSTSDGFLTRTWNFNEFTALKMERDGPSFDKLVPYIDAAPSAFEYENYSGEMSTWDDYGKWIATLNKGRNILPQATKDRVVALTKELPGREEKVKALYQFLQNKTRYVSIQLGIGGYQPFEASLVDQNGYGDCKALSNYMMALLDAAGIPSHYALINAGRYASPLEEDFPSSQFNHVLVAVPNDSDTLWLECTSQTNPFGYQGFHTGDRKALLITADGARLVKTKHYTVDDNFQNRFVDVYLEATGDGKATVRTTYSGLQYESEGISSVLNVQGEDQNKWIRDNTRIPTFDVISAKFESKAEQIPSATVTVDLLLRRYCTVSGKRVFLLPNLMNRSSYIPEKLAQRKTKIVRNFSYTDIDTVRYHMPENLYPEFLPEPTKFLSPFGEYECSFRLEQGSLIYVRKLRIFKGEFPAESYQDYTEFFKRINRADNTKVVFLSKT